MATIYKYISETTQISDRNYVPIILKIFVNENIQTQDINYLPIQYKIPVNEQENIQEIIYTIKRIAFKGYNSKIISCIPPEKQPICNKYTILYTNNITSTQTKKINTFYYNKNYLQKTCQINTKYENGTSDFLIQYSATNFRPNKLIWLITNNTETNFWENATGFYYINPIIGDTIILNYCFSPSYYNNDGSVCNLEVVELSNSFDIEFVGLSVGDIIKGDENFCFDVKISASSNYEDVINKNIGIKLRDCDGNEFYLTWLVWLKRQLPSYDLILYPDKNNYSETLFFNTLVFESTVGVRYVKATLDNPKINFSATYSNLNLYKHKFIENAQLINENKTVRFPLWSELVKTIEDKEKSQLIKVERIPKSITIGSKLLLIIEESKGTILTVNKIVDNNTIQIVEQTSYNKDMFIVPMIDVIPKNNASITRYTGNSNQITIEVSSKNMIKGLDIDI